MLRKVIAASGPVFLGASVVTTADKKSTVSTAKNENDVSHYKCKPSELPLYAPLYARKVQEIDEHRTESALGKTIESGIRAVRVEVAGAYDVAYSQTKNLDEYIKTGRNQVKSIVDYLNEPDNTAPRIGAVAIGGLSGFVLGLRGGFIRRVLYTGIGAGAIASICYPKEAGVYAQHGVVEAKRMATIAYNFAFGVKPGDDVNAPEWPKVPTNFSELSDSFSDLFRSAKDALFSSKK